MAERAAPIQERPRNPRVIRTVNKVMRPLLRSPLHRLVSKNLMLLSFTGRKSGKQYTLPVSYVQDGNVLLLGTETPWYKNLRGGVAVTAHVRGRNYQGTAEVIDDEAGMRQGYQTILTKYPGYGRFVDVQLDPDGQPNPEAVRRARERGLVVIRVQLDQTPVA